MSVVILSVHVCDRVLHGEHEDDMDAWHDTSELSEWSQDLFQENLECLDPWSGNDVLLSRQSEVLIQETNRRTTGESWLHMSIQSASWSEGSRTGIANCWLS